MSWDGSNRETINSNLPNPVGVTFLNDVIYGADANLQQLFAIPSSSNITNDVTILRSGLVNLVAVTAFSNDTQPSDGTRFHFQDFVHRQEDLFLISVYFF